MRFLSATSLRFRYLAPSLLLLMSLLFVGSACGQQQLGDSTARATLPDETADTTPIAQDTSTALPVEQPALLSHLTLAIDSDFPDPGIIFNGNIFYAYGTNGDGNNVRVSTSTDLIAWSKRPDALPSLPSWAQRNASLTWAPDVMALRSDSFVMYFTARHTASGKQCIGVANANNPLGPFVSTASGPIVCQTSLGGTIDASAFVASNGKKYLYYKNDGNCCNISVKLFGRQLSADGQSFAGAEQELLSVTNGWEGNLIEAPAVFESDGFFYLFYSANNYANGQYATGVARSSSPLGPFTKLTNSAPWLATDGNHLLGPGGLTPIRVGSQDYIFFHNWDSSSFRYRSMWIAPLHWANAAPVMTY